MPVTISSPNYPNFFNVGDQCIWLLTAPRGGFVNLQFVEQFQLQCEDTCDKSYVEVKADADFRPTGYRFCCSRVPRHIFQSATNEMVVIFRGFGDAGNGFKAKIWSNVDDDIANTIVTTEMAKISEKIPKLTVPIVKTITTPTITTTTAFMISPKKGNVTATRVAITTTPTTTITTTIAGTVPITVTNNTTPVVSETLPSLPVKIRNKIGACECGEWTEWTGPCSQECGGCGKRLRTRQCSSDTECRTEEKRACAFKVCPYGTNFLINNGEFHILWKGCCVGLFRSGDMCSALDDNENPFLKFLESLLNMQDSRKNDNLPDSKKK
ncbi:Zinc metalloproteinase nas-38 [Dirofilaria immitis]